MRVRTQLSFFLQNRPGTLEQVAASLAWADINIQGFAIVDAVDHAVVRMIVDDDRKAIHLLGGEHGLLVIETDVVELSCDDRPGQLHSIATKLAAADVNIHYAYGSVTTDTGMGTMFLRVDDVHKALEALKKE